MNYRYLIGLLIGIGLIVVVFIFIFRGGNSPAPAPNATARMVDYANTTTTVRVIQDLPVSADQTHHELVTTVGRDNVVFTVEQGYEGQVLRSQNYRNNSAAYAEFLRALQIAGYTNGVSDPKLVDERGYCPAGNRYIFEINDPNRTIQRYWSTTCGNIGNFKGKTQTILNLYQRQVPDYDKLTSGISL
jgi:hypothetical protein